ncbi:hypothetical protein [Candidatus Electronema sp. JM]|uniref:hypothetical protein n=1 Tax=Candidatus Electronema sp. JM TaxID=3401571 RepID=UPI003AA7CF81
MNKKRFRQQGRSGQSASNGCGTARNGKNRQEDGLKRGCLQSANGNKNEKILARQAEAGAAVLNGK